jgi:hypothetical protein
LASPDKADLGEQVRQGIVALAAESTGLAAVLDPFDPSMVRPSYPRSVVYAFPVGDNRCGRKSRMPRFVIATRICFPREGSKQLAEDQERRADGWRFRIQLKTKGNQSWQRTTKSSSHVP